MNRRRSATHEWWRRFIAKPWAVGLLLFVVFGVLLGTVDINSWFHTQGLVREQVVAIDRTETGGTVRCGGKYTRHREPEFAVTYRSENPPIERPEVFTNYEGCSAHKAGDRDEVVRTVDANGILTVWFNHPDTLWDAIMSVLYVAVPAGGAGLAIGYFNRAWQRRRAEESRGRHVDRNPL